MNSPSFSSKLAQVVVKNSLKGPGYFDTAFIFEKLDDDFQLFLQIFHLVSMLFNLIVFFLQFIGMILGQGCNLINLLLHGSINI